jgi:hypothetical protein
VEEKKQLYCVPSRMVGINPEKGFLTPIFDISSGEPEEIDLEEFSNNGEVHVTKGYKRLFGSSSVCGIYKVEANIGANWDPGDPRDSTSKYVTFDANIAPISKVVVARIIEGDYPNPDKSNTMVLRVSNMPPADPFFVSCRNSADADVLIGPVEIVRDSLKYSEDEYQFSYRAIDKPIGSEWQSINDVAHKALIFEAEHIAERSIMTAGGYRYVVGILPHGSATAIDLSTTDQLLKWTNKQLRALGSPSKDNISVIRDISEDLQKLEDIPPDILRARVERLNNLGNKLEEVEDFQQILTDYLSTEVGEKLVGKHVTLNQDKLLRRHLDQELRKVQDEVDGESDRLKGQAHLEIQQLIEKKENLEREVESLNETQLGIEFSELAQIRDERKIIETVEQLKYQQDYLRVENEKLRTEHREASNLLLSVQSSINQSEETHKKKLIDLKMGLEALSGLANPESDLKTIIAPGTKYRIFHSPITPEIAQRTLEEIIGVLERRGRVVDRDQTALMLTAVMQNIVVTLAGKPGSGKSSSVFELAKALGLVELQKYVHIQVQRGWSSDKDITGFYNKLSRHYEPDRHGLYKLITGLQDVDPSDQLALVLLDEANLSPVEHYWSGFMGAVDNVESYTPDGEIKLKFPEGLRFIATVNYDRTTEQLSPRFIDRSPVLYLEGLEGKRQFASAYDGEEYKQSAESINISYEDLKSIFGNSEGASLTSDEERLFNEIVSKHPFLPINHRKERAMVNMTHTLRSFMPVDLNAFDFALLVNILPMISGKGPHYKKCVGEFSSMIEQSGLSKSAKRMRQIIEASNFDSFSFFS